MFIKPLRRPRGIVFTHRTPSGQDLRIEITDRSAGGVAWVVWASHDLVFGGETVAVGAGCAVDADSALRASRDFCSGYDEVEREVMASLQKRLAGHGDDRTSTPAIMERILIPWVLSMSRIIDQLIPELPNTASAHEITLPP
ncbi:MAG TPA: hypothetical protein VNE67_08990 [Acetobacteraceae bacterium]|nr:hypothetical protein [Acetobacteraceae bacterium]